MKITQLLTLLATLIVAVIAASNAWAIGEPKNQSPFNRGIAKTLVDTTLSATKGAGPHGAAAIPGEIARATPVNTTSARSTASVASPPLRGTSASFHWRDAGIGALLATLLLCVAAAGAAHVRPRRPVGV